MAGKRTIRRVLIANRGEIAVRIARTLREMGVAAIGVASDPDLSALHALVCDQVVPLGGTTPLETYLDQEKVLAAAKETGADAIHPGYGFLAENASFAKAVEEAGLVWIGPPPESIALMGDKLAAREAVARAGVPVIPGSPALSDPARARAEAEKIGYPVMLKASAGGGGKGMRVVRTPDELEPSLEAARRESGKAFGDDTIYLEKFIERPRHIEFQVLADKRGNTVHLFERECSIQRRHQKIVEETPSAALDDKLRAEMGEAAVEAARAAGYTNAGTVEFIFGEGGKFYFLEMNTRLQVEHPVTEMTCGVDLVRRQVLAASGEPLPFSQKEITRRGHAIECRIYAEDPANNFFPSSGVIRALVEPAGPGIRNDTGVYEGMEVSTFYDPLLSKLVCFAEDREAGAKRMEKALRSYLVLGLSTSIPFLADLVAHRAFLEGDTCTDFIPKYMKDWTPRADKRAEAALLAALAGPARPGRSGAAGAPGAGPASFDVWQAVGRKGI